LGVDVQEVVPARGLTPEEVILAAERSIGLRQAVNRLDERCRRLIIMLFFAPEPPDYAQIAREFGLAEGSIGALRKRCLERLRQEIIHKSGDRRIF
jgi:RNA polymerase sigma factor (sigma-70 family)